MFDIDIPKPSWLQSKQNEMRYNEMRYNEMRRPSDPFIDFLKDEVQVTPEEQRKKQEKIEMLKNVTVEQIHKEFFSEVDRLLTEANIQSPLKEVNKELQDKADKLKKLGFSSSSDVGVAAADIRIVEDSNRETLEKKRLIKAINYFKRVYPQYKFITKESVRIICKKYNLVKGDVRFYVGNVPDTKVNEMLNFKIEEKDIPSTTAQWRNAGTGQTIYQKSYTSPQSIEEYGDDKLFGDYSHSTRKVTTRLAPFEIAAPIEEFDFPSHMTVTDNMELVEYKVEDPVVLQPVWYEGKQHYLIVTAWGDEASDELVVNETMN